MDNILAESIQELTGQTISRATETKESVHSGLYNTSWVISFLAETHCPLPRTLQILGASTTLSIIKSKPKIVQCSRCYRWHNAHSCIKPQHCRICGSTKHQEETHSTHCTAPSPHTCPTRCLNCRGPHPADNTNCPLCPMSRRLKTKSERTAILETSKTACIRACAAVKCSMTPTKTPQAPERSQSKQTTPLVSTWMEVLPPSPHTPT